jgi:hypothetical protein
MSNTIIRELIIKCPYTGTDINIAPFLYMISENDSPEELASILEQFIDDSIAFAPELLETDSHSVGYHVYLLSGVKRALRCMTPGKYTAEDLGRVFRAN